MYRTIIKRIILIITALLMLLSAALFVYTNHKSKQLITEKTTMDKNISDIKKAIDDDVKTIENQIDYDVASNENTATEITESLDQMNDALENENNKIKEEIECWERQTQKILPYLEL